MEGIAVFCIVVAWSGIMGLLEIARRRVNRGPSYHWPSFHFQTIQDDSVRPEHAKAEKIKFDTGSQQIKVTVLTKLVYRAKSYHSPNSVN